MNSRYIKALILGGALTVAGLTAAQSQTANNLICNGCVQSQDIANNGILSLDIRNNTVNTADIRNGTIRAEDMGNAIAAANEYSDGSITAALNGNTVAQTLVVATPSVGALVANASWNFGLNSNEDAECSVTLNNTTHSTTRYRNEASSDVNFQEVPGSITALFRPVPRGTHTIRLICRTTQGLTTIRKRSLTVTYLPRGGNIKVRSPANTTSNGALSNSSAAAEAARAAAADRPLAWSAGRHRSLVAG